MRILHEKIDNEKYLEISLSAQECEGVMDYGIVSKKIWIDGIETNIGIKLGLESNDDENYDFF